MGVRLLALALLASLLAAGCGGAPSRPGAHAAHGTPDNPVVTGPGRLVAIGGGRSLYLQCSGHGSPTVVLEAGFGGDTNNWTGVQPQLGATTRTCAYDRAGLGNSLPLPGVHDASAEIRDLQTLLEHARIAPPYVLVGHSYGGLLVRLFARAHPAETAGVVLVDAMGRDQDARYARWWRALPRSVRRALPAPGAPREYGVDLLASERLAAHVRSLGDVPLAVVTRGQAGLGGTAAARTAVMRAWTRMQDELAALSPDHVHVVAARSGHFVQSAADGQPGVVVRAVDAVVRAARTHTALPPCPRLFAGLAARCR